MHLLLDFLCIVNFAHYQLISLIVCLWLSCRTSRGVTGLLDKVCSVVVSLADLLSVAKLPDHTLLQLAKCMLDTLKLEDVELLQTKAIEVLCRVSC